MEHSFFFCLYYCYLRHWYILGLNINCLLLRFLIYIRLLLLSEIVHNLILGLETIHNTLELVLFRFKSNESFLVTYVWLILYLNVFLPLIFNEGLTGMFGLIHSTLYSRQKDYKWCQRLTLLLWLVPDFLSSWTCCSSTDSIYDGVFWDLCFLLAF